MSLLDVLKVTTLLLVLVSSHPFPQYDNVEILEYETEDEPEEQDEGAGGGVLGGVGAGGPGDGSLLLPPGVPVPPVSPVSEKAAFKIPDNYSVHKAPPLINGEAIPVEFSILVFNVFDIREIQEEISIEVNYKLQWRDTRLMNWTTNIEPGHKFTVISNTLLHRLWHPDIFIDHIKRVTQPVLISSAASLRLYSDGSLRYTARMLLALTCRMNFQYYPADTQECNVTMKSFAFSTKNILLGWKDGTGALLAKSIDVHNFDVALTTHEDYLQQTKSNNYTALSFGIRLRRKLSYHVIQTYVPSTLFTVVSWLSFLVPPDSTPGRMAICVTTLLTVTSMFGSVKQNTPNVSYIKALDLWMFMCIVFIFMSLAEFTLVLKLRSKKEKHKPNKQEDELKKANSVAPPSVVSNSIHAEAKPTVIPLPVSAITKFTSIVSIFKPTPPTTPAVGTGTGTAPSPPAPPPPPKPTRYALTAAKIEKYAPRALPLLFVVFSGIYWPYLLIASDYYNLEMNPEMYYSV